MKPTLVADLPLNATFYAEDYDSNCRVIDFYGMRALLLEHNGNIVLTGGYPNFTLITDYEGGEDAC